MNRPRRPGLGGNRNERGSGGWLAWLFRNLFALALIGGVIYYFVSPALGPRQAANGPQAAGERTAPPSAEAVELATTASINRQQLIAGKLKQRQAIAAFDELTRDLRDWEKEIAAWESEGPPLLRSEEGKRLSADATLVKQFRAVLKEDRPGRDAVRAARSQAEELIFPIRESLSNADDASPPSEFTVTTLRELQSRARNGRERYRQAREAVSVLLAQAPPAGVAPPAGTKTLERAIAELDREEARQRVATIEAAEKRARDEATRLVGQEKAKVIQAEAEAEAQRLRDEAAQKKQASELAAAKSVEEMELRQKEAAKDIDRLRAVGEQRRQGDLKSGSVWKGTYALNGRQTPGTMTIESRVKDKITGSMAYGAIPYSFTGTVNGNSVKFTPSQGMSMEMEFNCVLNPATKTITGRCQNATFTLRHSDGKDDE